MSFVTCSLKEDTMFTRTLTTLFAAAIVALTIGAVQAMAEFV